MLLGLALFGTSYCYSEVKSDDHIWRSTSPVAANDVLVATGVVRIWDIQVTSGAIGYGGFRFFNTTGTLAGGVSRTSSTFYNVSTIGDSYKVNEVLSRGFRYTFEGSGIVTIRWNWEFNAPSGLGGTGLK